MTDSITVDKAVLDALRVKAQTVSRGGSYICEAPKFTDDGPPPGVRIVHEYHLPVLFSDAANADAALTLAGNYAEHWRGALKVALRCVWCVASLESRRDFVGTVYYEMVPMIRERFEGVAGSETVLAHIYKFVPLTEETRLADQEQLFAVLDTFVRDMRKADVLCDVRPLLALRDLWTLTKGTTCASANSGPIVRCVDYLPPRVIQTFCEGVVINDMP